MQYDPVTGLTSLGARQYDPVTGQFISPDPLLVPSNPQNLNPYAYATDNPVTNSDPSGLLTCNQWGECYESTTSVPTVHVTPQTSADPNTRYLSQAVVAQYAIIAIVHSTRSAMGNARKAEDLQTPRNSYQCMRFGLECGGTYTDYSNSNDDTSLFFDWILGIYTNQYFNQWDPLTQYLMNDPNQSKALAAIRRALSAGGPYTGAAPYTDPKTVSAVVRDMKGYFTNGTDPSGSNYADAFLGSYQETWIAVPRNGNTATVYFQANNVTDLNSFAHPEVTTFGAMHSIDGLQTEISFIASIGGLDMYMFRPQSQEFQWQETVNY